MIEAGVPGIRNTVAVINPPLIEPTYIETSSTIASAGFVIENATKAGTIDLLMNAGALHNEVARLSLEQLTPVLGSSANTSLTGSKFRLEAVEQPVRNAAALQIDYGLCKYRNDKGLGSSIIDLSDFSTIRVGACYDQLRSIFREKFDIQLSEHARPQ